jgi:HK97 gp10 family phage protein
MAVTVVIKLNRIPEVAAQIHAAVGQAVQQTAAQVQTDAKSIVPVRTGALRDSIKTEMVGDLAAVVGSDLYYAVFVELGTRRMTARPFLTPAMETARVQFPSTIRDLIAGIR